MLDEQKLEEAVRLLGEKTYSAAVNRALDEVIRIQRVRKIPELLDQVRWIGNLSEMREDRPTRKKRA